MNNLDRSGRSVLHYAALENNVQETERLIAQGEQLDVQDQRGFTPLHFAAQEFSVEVAELLLNSDASVDPKNSFGNTPLFVAVFNSKGRGEMIAILRRYGANPLISNQSGQTPLGLARLIANYDVSQWFNDLE